MTALAVADLGADSFSCVFGAGRGSGRLAGDLAEAEAMLATGDLARALTFTRGIDHRAAAAGALADRLLSEVASRRFGSDTERLYMLGLTDTQSQWTVWVQEAGQPRQLHVLKYPRDVRSQLRLGGMTFLCGPVRRGTKGTAELARRGDWAANIGARPGPAACPDCHAAVVARNYSNPCMEPVGINLFPDHWGGDFPDLVRSSALTLAGHGLAGHATPQRLLDEADAIWHEQVIDSATARAVRLRDHAVRRACGEERYESMLLRYGFARGRAAKPTLWQDLRDAWPGLLTWAFDKEDLDAEQVWRRYDAELARAHAQRA